MDNLENMLSGMRKEILEKVGEYFILSQEKGVVVPKPYVKYVWRVWDQNEIKAAISSVLEQKITYGNIAKEFENEFSRFLDTRYTIYVNSGSSANLIAVSSLKSRMFGDTIKSDDERYQIIRDGDEVITPAATFPTTSNVLLINNLLPVFVDIELGTYNMNPKDIESAITDKTRLIMLPHTLGNPNDMDPILEIAKKNKIFLIEDACDSLGSEYKGKKLGTFGDMGSFSFYLSHHISTGEGGAVVTKNSELKRVLDSMRDWGRDCWCEPYKSNTCGKRFEWQLGDLPFGYDHKYTYSNIGFNLKPLDLQAAIGLEQIKKLPNIIIKKRRENFKKLYEGLKNFEEFLILPKSIEGADPCWFSVPLTVRDEKVFSRNDIVNYLAENEIETRPFFAGNIIKQPGYKGAKYRIHHRLENTDKAMFGTFFIGCHPGLNDEMINYVLDKFKNYFNKL
ncbi:MAG: CDP-4-dehydro-6-deoxy-D-glucose 3-dehydratase [archaeon GW2011_AR20]|nr:MAG: CDP-4-dehydro-6-deoxy-D-glucose 3-dehydratase [archaeon GW2011_AR20]AQS28198.1 hypothetical protein [uncultured archaeon]MBS3160508.1 lipopolysaccharide biosynthesis protein RfbH [Candidatus Woesearchaeota archaeon]